LRFCGFFVITGAQKNGQYKRSNKEPDRRQTFHKSSGHIEVIQFSGLIIWKDTTRAARHTIFFHPDCTVGAGI
jgi:hypothetical protein